MERKVTNPFIVSWNHKRLKLSDGSHQKEFYDHDEAIAFLEAEMNKVEYEKSTPETKAEYRKKYGTEYSGTAPMHPGREGRYPPVWCQLLLHHTLQPT